MRVPKIRARPRHGIRKNVRATHDSRTTGDNPTLADACERLRTLAHAAHRFRVNSLTPRPPTSKREPFCCAFGKKQVTKKFPFAGLVSELKFQPGLALRARGAESTKTPSHIFTQNDTTPNKLEESKQRFAAPLCASCKVLLLEVSVVVQNVIHQFNFKRT